MGAPLSAERPSFSTNLINRRQLRERLPVSDMTIWRWVKAGVLAAPVKINGRNYWRDIDVARLVDRAEESP